MTTINILPANVNVNYCCENLPDGTFQGWNDVKGRICCLSNGTWLFQNLGIVGVVYAARVSPTSPGQPVDSVID